MRGCKRLFPDSVQSNRRSLKRWKQVAYSAPWSMKPMQLVPMVWWIRHPFLSLDPFPSIFAPTIRRIFLFHTLSNPPRLSWSMHDFRKLVWIFHDVRFKWIMLYDLFSFCTFSRYEILILDERTIRENTWN